MCGPGMFDLNMPEGLSYEECRAWLKKTGAAIVEETGEPTGQLTFRDAQGRKGFAMWWTAEGYHGPYETADSEHHDSANDQSEPQSGDGPATKPTAES